MSWMSSAAFTRIALIRSKKPKARVKRIMSRDYQQLVEMNDPIRYAQIRIDGECLYNFFAKGYNGEDNQVDR